VCGEHSFPKRCYENPDFQSGFYPTICDHQHGWLVGSYMRIAKTTDGGDSWALQQQFAFDSSQSASTTLRAVVGLGEEASSALAVGDNGFILFTTNGGASPAIRCNACPPPSPPFPTHPLTCHTIQWRRHTGSNGVRWSPQRWLTAKFRGFSSCGRS